MLTAVSFPRSRSAEFGQSDLENTSGTRGLHGSHTGTLNDGEPIPTGIGVKDLTHLILSIQTGIHGG